MEKCSISAERSLVSLNMTCCPPFVSLTMSCGPYLKSSNIFISDDAKMLKHASSNLFKLCHVFCCYVLTIMYKLNLVEIPI